MLSFWENDRIGINDVVIIGAGICGLSLAASLKEKNPNLKICVADRSPMGWGASTRNAGFACFGSLTEVLSDIKLNGEEKAVELLRKRISGLQKLQNRLQNRDIGYERFGGYELITETESSCLDQIDSMNEILKEAVGPNTYNDRTDWIQKLGFNKSIVKHLIYSPYEAQIHSGKMMLALQQYAMELGIEVIRGMEVIHYERTEKKVDVSLKNSHNGNTYTIYGKQLVFATNAEINLFFEDSGIKPGRGQILLTNEIENLKWQGVFHYDEGYYYFRNVGKRILLGGGRNMDFEGECTYAFELNETLQNNLEKKLRDMIIPDVEFNVDMRWSGIMGFTKNKLPLIGHDGNNVHYVCTCNGMGVALASEVADELSEKLIQNL